MVQSISIRMVQLRAGFTGTDTFSYAVDDGRGGTHTATVRVTINPLPLPGQDRDGVPDAQDNCPTKANPDQRDTDGDVIQVLHVIQ